MCNKCEDNKNCLCLCNKYPREINLQYLDSNNIPCSICPDCNHNSSYNGIKDNMNSLKLKGNSVVF